MCVTEDSHRNIWVGTRHGLFRYNASDNSFTRFTVADGLPNDFVYGILEDELARLWISTNNGMACFDTRKKLLPAATPCATESPTTSSTSTPTAEPRRHLLVRRHRRHHVVPAPRPGGQPLCARTADHGRRCGRCRRRPPRAHRARFGGSGHGGGVPLGAQHLHGALRGGQSAGRGLQHLRLQARRIQHPLVRDLAPRGQLLEPQARALCLQGSRGKQRRTLERRACDGRNPRAADVVADPRGEGFCGRCWRWDSSGASWRRCWAA